LQRRAKTAHLFAVLRPVAALVLRHLDARHRPALRSFHPIVPQQQIRTIRITRIDSLSRYAYNDYDDGEDPRNIIRRRPMATRKLDRQKLDADALKAEQAAQAYVRCSLSFEWPGTSRAVKGELRDEVVDTLEADSAAVSAATRMYNWRQSALSQVRAL